jgi:radical SAM protein with 4Fe4S-binding SPASM domain
MHPSFFIYSPFQSEDIKQTAHVILHTHEARWLVVNDTGLEIAHHLDKGESIEKIAQHLVVKYGISAEVAKNDVVSVSEQLSQQHFLGEKKGELPIRSPTLNSVHFHLTNRCNLSCAHCYLSCPDSLTFMDIPVPLAFRLIDELVENGGKEVILSGGEPLLHPEIKKIFKYAASRLRIRLLTNGTLIGREWAAFLADIDCSLQISLDSSKSESHDAIRGKGSFAQVIRAIEYLQEAGMGKRILLSTTIMRQNIHDLKDIISLAETLRIPLIRFLPLRKTGSAKKKWSSIGAGIGVKEYEKFYQYIFDLQVNHKCPLEISCGLSGFLLKMPEDFSGDSLWCQIGRQLVIDFNGDTYPCALLMTNEFLLGNAYIDSLSKMVQSDKMKRLCRSVSGRRVKIKKCAICDWRNFCQAGCMGEALEHQGTIWDSDNFCDYRKTAYKETFDKILRSAM